MPRATRKAPRPPPASTKYNAHTPLRAYRLARQRLTNTDLAALLGISRTLFDRWLKDHPEFAEAVRLGREDTGQEGGTLGEWLYGRLSPEVRDTWQKLQAWYSEPSAVVGMELILADHGRRARQELFLQALVSFAFNPSEAMRAVGVSKKELQGWVDHDEAFAELFAEVQWHKKNYFESALFKLVENGDAAATVFANKTLNSDRGYQVKSKLDVEHSGAVLHGMLDLSDLLPHLSDAARLEVLEGIRRVSEARPAPPDAPVDHRELLGHAIAKAAEEIPANP